MSSDTLTRTPDEVIGNRRVLLAVARFEARRIWRHPALLPAVLITGYELYRQTDWSGAPVLNRDSYTTAWPMIILAAGVYLAIGSAAGRRHGVHGDEGLRGLPASPTTQTLGIGLAFVSPLLAAFVMQGGVLVLRALDSPVTSIVWSEALTGPATVALGAAAGLAIGWGIRSPLALPIAGVAFVGGILTLWWVASGYLFGPYTPWLAPVTTLDWNQYTLEQAHRPSGIHLAYTASLIGLLVTLATIRGTRDGARIRTAALAVVFLAGAVWAGMTQLDVPTAAEEEDRRAPYDPSTGDYTCEQRGPVIYCAYQGYEPWIEEWAGQVEPVLALVPGEIGTRPLEIRQQVPYYLDEDELPPVADLTAGMWWSRAAYDSTLVAHRLGMALAAAGWAVGFPSRTLPVRTTVVDDRIVTEPAGADAVDPDEIEYRACGSEGQARAVAALWLAAESSPQALEALRFAASGDRYRGLSPQDNLSIDIGYRQPSSSVVYFRREAMVALHLHERPVDEVSSTLARRWDVLVDPATTTADIAGWFDLAVPDMRPADDSWTIPCP